MTVGWFFVLIAVVWLTTGLILAVVMGRRGYAAWSWLVIGAVFGPLAVVLAIDRARHRRDTSYAVTAGTPGPGPVDLLVGIDGSSEAEAAAIGATGILGLRLGRVTLVAVVPYNSTHEAEREARTNLHQVAAGLREGSVDTEILSGLPADELVRRARQGGYEVIAVGVRGQGRSKAVLGSTASQLARGSKEVPVFIFGSDSERPIAD